MKFVTLITEDFLPGLRALCRSLVKNSGFKPEEIEMLILLEGLKQLPAKDQDDLSRTGINSTIIEREEIGTFILPREKIGEVRFVASLQKLVIFKLSVNDLRCWIDADKICIGNITEIVMFEHFTVPLNFGRTLPPTPSHHGHPEFCAGTFIFRPSISLFDEIQEFASTYNGVFRYADQCLLNEFFWSRYPNDVHLLGIEWSGLKHVPIYHLKLWAKLKPKFLHFVSEKPWKKQSPKIEHDYKTVNKLWWQIYNAEI